MFPSCDPNEDISSFSLFLSSFSFFFSFSFFDDDEDRMDEDDAERGGVLESSGGCGLTDLPTVSIGCDEDDDPSSSDVRIVRRLSSNTEGVWNSWVFDEEAFVLAPFLPLLSFAILPESLLPEVLLLFPEDESFSGVEN